MFTAADELSQLPSRKNPVSNSQAPGKRYSFIERAQKNRFYDLAKNAIHPSRRATGWVEMLRRGGRDGFDFDQEAGLWEGGNN